MWASQVVDAKDTRPLSPSPPPPPPPPPPQKKKKEEEEEEEENMSWPCQTSKMS